MIGDIKIRCRPLRLAFLIPPTKAALREAIQVSCSLWGGGFNPIIPIYTRAPSAWKLYPRERINLERRNRGYIQAFDPDVLVDCTNGTLPSYFGTLHRTVVKIEEIWKRFYADEEQFPSYGIGIFELFNGIYKEYFETVRRFPRQVLLPTGDDSEALFWAAVVGELPEKLQASVEEVFEQAVDIQKPKLSAQTFPTLLRQRSLFPRHISRHALEGERTGLRMNQAYGFYMDLTKFGDLVDFWNLRALGRPVVPIPKQFANSPEWLEYVRGFVHEHFGVDRHNRSVTYGTSIVRSFSSDMSDLQAFAKALDLPNLFPEHPDSRAVVLQHWYPRIWDEWAIGKDHAQPDAIFSKTDEISLPEVRGAISLDFVKPEFAANIMGETPRYANELYPRFFGFGEDLLADVLPYDHGSEVLRVSGGFSFISNDEFRIGRNGPVHLVRWRNRTQWSPPVAEEVFFAWLKDKGFASELSTCGRLAKQMYAQLRGWTSMLTNEPLVRLFDSMAKGGEDGRGAPLGEVKSRLRSIGHNRDDLYRNLNERNVFQLGYKTQCIHCGRNSWFSVDDLAAELTCPLCHRKLDAIRAVDSSSGGAWHLKMAGPFSVERHAVNRRSNLTPHRRPILTPSRGGVYW